MKQTSQVLIEKGILPAPAPQETILIVTNLDGKAHVERGRKHYLLVGTRPPKGINSARYGVAHGDWFWLEKGATADLAIFSKNGITPFQRIGRNCEARTRYTKDWVDAIFTNALVRGGNMAQKMDTEGVLMPLNVTHAIIRNLLVHSGNSKPLHNDDLPQLLLPLTNTLVRPSFIPYRFWQGKGKAAETVELIYLKNSGNIALEKQPTRKTGNGIVKLDRANVVKQLQKAFGEEGNWKNELIPFNLKLTTASEKDGDKKIYVAANLMLQTDALSSEAEKDFRALDALIMSTSNPNDFVKLAQLSARLETYLPEYLYRMSQKIPRKDPNNFAYSLLNDYCERNGIDAERLLAR
jgi:hypothetical protein